MPSLKRFFASPFKSGNPNRNSSRVGSRPIKANDRESSSSPLTIPTVVTSTRGQPAKDDDESFSEDQHDYDDFRTTVMASTSVDTCGNDNATEDSLNDICHELEKAMVDYGDFKTTVMPSKSTETNSPSKETRTGENDDDHSEKQMDYIPSLEKENEVKQNNSAHAPFSKYMNDDDERDHESPINSVVFEKHLDTGHPHNCVTEKMGSPSQMSPLMSPYSDSDEREEFNFDDYRSTISVLTEATNFRDKRTIRIVPPPSPTNSTISDGTKKMADFLKTESEAIRQLLSEVESGDEESTVVEEAERGANEAEQMAREMEREMALLVHGNQEKEENRPSTEVTTGVDDSQALHDSPDSNQFLSDIRSVIHPCPETSFDHHGDIDSHSMVSSISRNSLTSQYSSRRDLFRKRRSLYKLREQKEPKKKTYKKKLRKCIRYFLRTLFLMLVLSSTVFAVNWKWSFPDQDFSNARKSTISQLGKHASISLETRAKMKTFVDNTTRATQSFMESQMEVFATKFDGAKDRTLIVAEQTKIHVIYALKLTNKFALSVRSYAPTSEIKAQVFESLYSTKQYVRDRVEYAFTDRAAREKRVKEEEKFQELLEAAVAAGAKEAAEQNQQLWTQTIFAGACAFVGSVATNYIWATL